MKVAKGIISCSGAPVFSENNLEATSELSALIAMSLDIKLSAKEEPNLTLLEESITPLTVCNALTAGLKLYPNTFLIESGISFLAFNAPRFCL